MMNKRVGKYIRISRFPVPHTEADLARKTFVFYGIVKVVGTSSILVTRGDNDHWEIWLEFGKGSVQYRKEDKYKFEVIIKHYVSKEGHIRTKFRIINSEKLTELEQLGLGFEEERMPMKIISCERTDIPKLMSMKLARMDTGEQKEEYNMRFYNQSSEELIVGDTAIVRFQVIHSKQIICENGEVTVRMELYPVKKDGEVTMQERAVYYPVLSIVEFIK